MEEMIRKIRTGVFPILVLLGSIGCAVDFYTPTESLKACFDVPMDPHLPNVLLIGDSISIQYTPVVHSQLKGIANIVRPYDRKQSQPVNCGSTLTGLDGIDQWLGTNHWDVIHFNWGLHDLCYRNPQVTHIYGNRDKVNGVRSVSIDQYRSNLEELVVRLKRTGANLIWASTTVIPGGEPGRFRGDEIECNRIALEIMKKNGVAIDDLHGLSSTFSEKLFQAPGDVHYSEEGFKKLGEQVARVVLGVLNDRQIDLGKARLHDHLKSADPLLDYGSVRN
jgi:hypothetical protein